jgi:sulfide:quinone oxidoreductase
LGSWFSSKCKTTFHGTEIPFTIPKTGYPSDETGKIVAENVLEPSMEEPTLKKNLGGITGLCIMDAGKKEVIIVSDTLLNLENLQLCFRIFYLTSIKSPRKIFPLEIKKRIFFLAIKN